MSLLMACSPAAFATDWKLQVGPGAEVLPAYPGARQLHTVWFPYIDAEFDERIYTSGDDLLGVYAYKTENTQVGGAVEYDLTQRRIKGLPNVDRTARFKLFGSQTVQMITAEANVARDVNGGHEGTIGRANLWATLPVGSKLSLSAGPGLMWGDRQYMQTYFAVTATEADRSAFREYFARAGVVDTRLNGFLQWDVAPRCQLGLLAYAAHLRGGALQSPITVQHEQTSVTGWVAYRLK
jgi:outer membrane scaffolding protein for murein synthesis (MipA/OmpV family)